MLNRMRVRGPIGGMQLAQTARHGQERLQEQVRTENRKQETEHRKQKTGG